MRQSADIVIHSAQNIAVPITPESRRRWRLMEEDSITLSFNLSETKPFKIGDYIEDEIFGKFLITEEQAPPEYNVETGAFYYTLRFDREYIGWKNFVFMLTYGTTRRETEWTLTDKLSVHLDEIIRNLSILGYNYSYEINVEGAERAACITYSGTDIYSALKTLCSTYRCEFWVKDNVIHFGKCETGDTVDFNLNLEDAIYLFGNEDQLFSSDPAALTVGMDDGTVNVQQVTPSRNENEYANRLYVFGSTKNIPETYRKDLIFNLDEKRGTETPITLTWTDGKEVANGELVDSEIFSVSQLIDVSSLDWLTLSRPSYYCLVYGYDGAYHEIYSNSGNLKTDYDVSGWSQVLIQILTTEKSLLTCVGKTDGVYFRDSSRVLKPNMIAGGSEEVAFNPTKSGDNFSETVTLYGGNYNLYGAFKLKLGCVSKLPGNVGKVDYSVYFDNTLIKTASETLKNGTDGAWSGILTSTLSLNETVSASGSKELKISIAITQYSGEQLTYDNFETDIKFVSTGIPISMAILVNGVSKNVVYNEPQDNEGWLKCADSIPIGTEFTIDPQYLEEVQIPSAYYTDTEGDPNSLRLLGARRLMLPEGTPYIGDPMPSDKLVEKVVIFEDIFPRCALRITSISEKERTIETEYSDGSSRRNTYTEFTIKARRITPNGDVEFPFSKVYLTPDPLQLKFITQDEETKYSDGIPHGKANGYLLSGMTFDLQWNESDASYTIAYNNDFGAQLPNSVLRPKVGDPFILIGWNTKGMSALGLISDAENELEAAGELYKEALKDDSYTFDCAMMSDWAQTEGVLEFGQKVRVVRGSLVKESRMIGYELKLDIPYDTPTYTIGETEAYSRLRNLQEKLNILTLQGSSSGNTIVTNVSGPSTPSTGASSLSDLEDVDPEGAEGGSHLIWDSERQKWVVDRQKYDNYFQPNQNDTSLIELKPDFEHLGPGKGLVFSPTAETDVASSPAHLMLRNLGTSASPNYALYTPYALITGGDQIVKSGTPGGGGGGSIPYLHELQDVAGSVTGKPSGQKILIFDPTATDKNGQIGAWKYADVPTGSITSVALEQGIANGSLRLVVNGTPGQDVIVKGLGSFAFKNSLVVSDIPDLSGVYLPNAHDQNTVDANTVINSGLVVAPFSNTPAQYYGELFTLAYDQWRTVQLFGHEEWGNTHKLHVRFSYNSTGTTEGTRVYTSWYELIHSGGGQTIGGDLSLQSSAPRLYLKTNNSDYNAVICADESFGAAFSIKYSVSGYANQTLLSAGFSGGSPYASIFSGRYGTLEINALIRTSGDQVVNSDKTLKKNIQDLKYTVEDIAKAPAVSFDWKDKEGHSFGSIAQYWKPICPEMVHGVEGQYSLAYAQGAFTNTILLARRIVELEKQIKELKDKHGIE